MTESIVEVRKMGRLKAPPSSNRLERLSDERDKLKTELVQIHSMLISIEELIADEILRQAIDSPPGEVPTRGNATEDR